MIYCRQGRTRFYAAIAWCRVVANNVKEAKNNRSKPQNRDRELSWVSPPNLPKQTLGRFFMEWK